MGATEYTRPNIVDAGPKAAHWIFTLCLLFLLPSLNCCLVFADRTNYSLILQSVITLYSVCEVSFLSFPDGDGVENITSSVLGGIILGMNILSLSLNFILRKQGQGKIKQWIGYLHRTLSFALVLAGWVKVCLAPVALFGFCRPGHTGQCAAHGIMGSAFVWYGFVYSLVLVVPWIRKSDYSQDHIDSWVMCLWGIVNTFTEHRWGREDWFMHDYQHTAMGIIWWSGGILGIFLSRKGKRTFVPSLLIIFTGWAMSQHHQHLEISTHVHAFFGMVLMLGGALRIIEITFLLKDANNTNDEILSFQYLSTFCLVSSGILFMGATEEQLKLVMRLGADHSAYILVLLSGACLLFCWIQVCLNFYVYLMDTKGTRLDDYESLYQEFTQSPIADTDVTETSESFEL